MAQQVDKLWGLIPIMERERELLLRTLNIVIQTDRGCDETARGLWRCVNAEEDELKALYAKIQDEPEDWEL